jgi:hypothetical protein
MAKADEHYVLESLPLLKKNKKEDKISQQEVFNKQTVELEKEQLLFDSGNAKEIKITFN